MTRIPHFITIRRMKDIYPMWRLCYLFRLNETSWMKDKYKEDFLKDNPNATKEKIGIAILEGLLSGVNPGKEKKEVLKSYLHHSNEKRRIGNSGQAILLDIFDDPTAFPLVEYAVSILNSCIDREYIRQNEKETNIIYLTEKGRTFVSKPYFKTFLFFWKKTWNIQLLNEWITTFGELRTILISIGATVIALNWPEIINFFKSIPSSITEIIILLGLILFLKKKNGQ